MTSLLKQTSLNKLLVTWHWELAKMNGLFCSRHDPSPSVSAVRSPYTVSCSDVKRLRSLHLCCWLYCELRLGTSNSSEFQNFLNSLLILTSSLHNFDLLHLPSCKSPESDYKPFNKFVQVVCPKIRWQRSWGNLLVLFWNKCHFGGLPEAPNHFVLHLLSHKLASWQTCFDVLTPNSLFSYELNISSAARVWLYAPALLPEMAACMTTNGMNILSLVQLMNILPSDTRSPSDKKRYKWYDIWDAGLLT